MDFITIRDLRNKSAQIQRQLTKEREMVVTSRGKAIAILTAVSPQTLEETLTALRRARAIAAVADTQQKAQEAELDRLSMADIDKEINEQRKARRGRRG